ncbi:hypothetical protein ACFWAR_28855 [Streptomyces sp. NPDC059917]|uniref:WXG100-like domain-containing protein n=1 Tax=Streptomyces sp. NPDC059917 TaxID=3347002 RepID=UPI00365C5778
MTWPPADESQLESAGTDYAALCTAIEKLNTGGNAAIGHIVGGRSRGETVAAIDASWTAFKTRGMRTLNEACGQLSGAAATFDGLVLQCKTGIRDVLASASVQSIVAAPGAVLTGGASQTAVVAQARSAVRQVLTATAHELYRTIKDVDAVLANLEAGLTDGFESGKIAPEQDQGVVIDDDEFAQARSGLGTSTTAFGTAVGTFRGVAPGRLTSLHGDDVFREAGAAMDRAQETVARKAAELVQGLDDFADKIGLSVASHASHDQDRRRAFDRLDPGPVPYGPYVPAPTPGGGGAGTGG